MEKILGLGGWFTLSEMGLAVWLPDFHHLIDPELYYHFLKMAEIFVQISVETVAKGAKQKG